jgi:uncharacterized protein with gpF-like domain
MVALVTRISSSVFDLNRELRAIDRASDRRTQSIARAIESRCSRQIFAGNEIDLSFAQTALEELILDAMVASHLKALGISRPAYALSKSSVDKVLRDAPKHVKDALRKIYGSIARSVAEKPMSKVREALMGQAQAISLGQTKKKSDIRAALKSAGISMDDSPILRTVMRTQTALAFNAAAWNASQQNDELWGLSVHDASR